MRRYNLGAHTKTDLKAHLVSGMGCIATKSDVSILDAESKEGILVI